MIPQSENFRLFDAVSCIVKEELNGEYSLELQYPVDGEAISDLAPGKTILARCPSWTVDNGSFVNAFTVEEFDIYKTELTIDGLLTVYANHVSRRLAGRIYAGSTLYGSLSSMTGKTTPAAGIGIHGASGSQSEAVEDLPKSILACMIGSENSMSSLWGYEFAFSYHETVNPGNDVGVWQFTQRGDNRGAIVRFGLNLTDINYTQDRIAAFNAIVPYAKKKDGTVVYVTSGGNPTYVQPSTPPAGAVYAVQMDFSSEFTDDSQITQAALTTKARNYLDGNTPWIGDNTIEADFLNGAEIEPHSPEVWLGDTIGVAWHNAGVQTFMRVVGYEYDVIAEIYNTMQLGTQQTEFVAVTGDSIGGGSKGGGANDYIVETGTTGIWTWRKWSSGIAECWGASEYTVNMTTVWTNPIYYYNSVLQEALPSGLFVSADECQYSASPGAGQSGADCWAGIASQYPLTTTNTCGLYLLRIGSASNKKIKINWSVKGRWN